MRTDAIIANVMFGVGGALAITTAILAATARWRDVTPTRPTRVAWLRPTQVTPLLSRDAAALQALWRF